MSKARVKQKEATPSPAASSTPEKAFVFGVGLLVGLVIGIVGTRILSGGNSSIPPPPPVALNQDSDAQTAIANLRKILANDPNNYQALVQLGNAYYDTNQPAQAVEFYEKALAIDGSSADVLTDLGSMYRSLKRFNDAISRFRRATELNPRHPNSRYNLGLVYVYDLQDYQKGIEAWEGLLAVDPQGPRSEDVRGKLAGLKGMLSQPSQGGTGTPGAGQARTLPPGHPDLGNLPPLPVPPGGGR
jgi:tetratricopeptide (TPR) repeat protein